MMSKIFNTIFEISLRTVIILSEYNDSSLSADMIAAIDFISIYGKSFGLSNTNLHGDNPFKFSEFANRRNLIHQALKQLVANGLAVVSYGENGFTYSITKNGLIYSDSLENKYANKLREMIYKARIYTNDKSTKDILNIINKASIHSLRKGGK